MIICDVNTSTQPCFEFLCALFRMDLVVHLEKFCSFYFYNLCDVISFTPPCLKIDIVRLIVSLLVKILKLLK